MKNYKHISSIFSKGITSALTAMVIISSIPASGIYADEKASLPKPLVEYNFENNLDSTGSQKVTATEVTRLTPYDDSAIVSHKGNISYVEGKDGQAAYLNGETALNLNITMDAETYTFSYWVKVDTITNFTPSLIINRTNFSADTFINVTLTTGWSSPVIWTHIVQPNDVRYETGIFGALETNEWLHIAFTVDGDQVIEEDPEHRRTTLYLNGYEVATGYVPTEICTPESTYYFGVNIWDPLYVGAVDQFKCYDTLLNAEQVKALYLEDGGDPNASNPIDDSNDKWNDWWNNNDWGGGGNDGGDHGGGDHNDNNNDWNDNGNNNDPVSDSHGNSTILDGDFNSNDYLHLYVEPPTEKESYSANEVNPFSLYGGDAIDLFYLIAFILFTVVLVIFFTIYKQSKQKY
ncbi:MAG: LamG domain-containing protein [Lachnospiraceae bacterium]|nr:LamG domain-containing protein [Lachnospiraceae bacterium]